MVGYIYEMNLKINSIDLLKEYKVNLVEALEYLDLENIYSVANVINSLASNSLVFTVGNGGSATTASHMATDFGVGSLRRRNPVRAISLTDNIGVLTATSNDLSYADVFSEQLKLLAKPNDFLILISASGNSENLLRACETAKKLRVKTLSLTGFNGGELKNVTDLNIHVPSKMGSYGIVEDVHSMISHMITECIRAAPSIQ